MKYHSYFLIALLFTSLGIGCASSPTKTSIVDLGIHDPSVPEEHTCVLVIPRNVRIRSFDRETVDWFNLASDRLANKKWYAIRIPSGTRHFTYDISDGGYTESGTSAWELESGITYSIIGSLSRVVYGNAVLIIFDKDLHKGARELTDKERRNLETEIMERQIQNRQAE